jgi:hypothetical protein
MAGKPRSGLKPEHAHLFGGQAVAGSVIKTVQFGLMKAARFEPGLEPVLGPVEPAGTRGRVVRRQPEMRRIAAARPARQRKPGRKSGGMIAGDRPGARVLFFFNLHVCLIVWGGTSGKSAKLH